MSTSAYTESLHAIEKDEPKEGGFNPALMPHINAGRKEGVSDEVIREQLIAHAPERVADRAEKEIDRAMERAYMVHAAKPMYAASSFQLEPLQIDPVSLPKPMDDPWSTFLLGLFRPEESVVICPGILDGEKSSPNTRKATVHTCEEWITKLDKFNGPSGLWPETKEPNAGCFVIVNPATGPKINDVTRPSHFLVEMDSGNKDQQLGVLRESGLPFVSLVDSGNKSLHAICKTDSVSTDELKATAKMVYEALGPFSSSINNAAIDVGNCSANRYTRMPGSYRGENIQSLLELNREATVAEKWLPKSRDRALLLELGDIVSGSDLITCEPPPREPVLEGFFDLGDKVVLIGSSKSRKTFFAIQLALQLACEKPSMNAVDADNEVKEFILDPLADPSDIDLQETFVQWKMPRRRKVLYLNYELKAGHLHRRVRNMAESLGFSGEDIGDFFQACNMRGKPSSADHILALARKYCPEVIIIDPLYKVLEGDENSAQDMKPFLAAMDFLTVENNTCVILVHHNSKGRAGDKDIRDRGAGSGVLARDFDSGLYITDHIQQEPNLVLSTIARNYAPSPAISIAWNDGCFVPTSEAAVELTTSNSKKSVAMKSVNKEVVLDVLRQGTLSKTVLVEALKGKGGTRDGSKALIEELVDQGVIHTQREAKPAGRNMHGTLAQIQEMRRTQGDELPELP